MAKKAKKVETPSFDKAEDILLDPKFKEILSERLHKFQFRPAAPAGMHYVRGAWEYLEENKYFDFTSFMELFHSIAKREGKKKPMVVRDFVKNTVVNAASATLNYYIELEVKSHGTEKQNPTS